MRLTAFTDYGLRALMRLAGDPDRAFNTDRVASELGISRNHLTKVVQDLAKGGYLKTQRGAAGGIRLAKAAETITLGEVVRLLERRHAMVECYRTDGGACTLSPNCRLKGKLADAREAFMRELDKTTLDQCAHRGPLQGAA